jgi:predicted DNA-binding protein YlxM (UPF0122 family)
LIFLLDKPSGIRYTAPVKKIALQVVNFMEHSETQIEKLDEIVQQSILYDFYGELLSEHKKRIFEDYVLNDLSLSEIAAEQGISGQGVYDIVKRCTLELKEYEEKLTLVRKFQSIKDKLNRIKSIVSETTNTGDLAALNNITTLADDILKEL